MKYLHLLFILVGLQCLTNCAGSRKPVGVSTGVSKTTGWRYNNPFFGGFEVRDMRGQPTGPGLVFVPGGTFTMGRVAEDIPGDWNNVPRRVSIGSYYIDATEVRNVDYREYLHWLAMVYVSYPDVARAALPDTLSWRKPLAYNEPLVEYYFRLASFNEYPVVGVSWIQACDFCSWRTDRVNEVTLLQAGILELDIQGQKDDNCFTTDAYLAGVYEGKVRRNLPDLSGRKPEGRRVSYEDGILFPKYRLPTEAEWEYAAVAPIGSPVTGMVPDRGPYPWRGYQLRKTDITGTKSMVLANFQKGRGDLMGVAGNTEGSPTPMPVVSFYPNDFGLYCMAGNVNEWVLDVYRALTFEEMNDARPYRGNIYTTMVTDETGTPVKDHLGRIKRDTLGYVTDRENYKVGDNRNYEDGDILSSMPTEGAGKKEAQISSNRMYYQGKGENHLGMSSLVNERSRVYKGGSFMDRAYWLSPGTRRFLDEGRAKEDIGFRCAMDRMGASEFRAASPR